MAVVSVHPCMWLFSLMSHACTLPSGSPVATGALHHNPSVWLVEALLALSRYARRHAVRFIHAAASCDRSKCVVSGSRRQ